jgi:hypothetical protein
MAAENAKHRCPPNRPNSTVHVISNVDGMDLSKTSKAKLRYWMPPPHSHSIVPGGLLVMS